MYTHSKLSHRMKNSACTILIQFPTSHFFFKLTLIVKVSLLQSDSLSVGILLELRIFVLNILNAQQSLEGMNFDKNYQVELNCLQIKK